MTGPNPEIGRAEIEVTADTSNFPRDAERGVEESLRQTDPKMKQAGERWGDELSDNLQRRFKSRIPKIVDQAIADLDKEHITEHVKVSTDEDVDHDSIKRTVRNIADGLENEVKNSNIGGSLSSVITDAIGAGFNVSGRSPLIALLIPVFGAIAGLIAAAIEAVYGLGAALLTIPNLIGAIALQAGVLYLIFKDIGGALSAALGAQNALELQKALKGLDPYIQNFILEVVYIRDAFKDISGYLSLSFFKTLGNTLLDVFDYNRYTLFTGLENLASNLGKWFATVGQAFETPEFAKFLYDLFQEIDKFLTANGPVLQKFLTQVFQFLDSLMGATGDVGKLFNDFLTTFGNWLAETSKSKDFQDWLAKMPGILHDAGVLIAALLDLALQLFASVDRADGQKFLKVFTDLVNVLTWLFSTKEGVDALRDLLGIIVVLIGIFDALVIAVVSVLAILQEFFDWIVNTVGPAIGNFFKQWAEGFAKGFNPQFFLDIITKVKTFFTDLAEGAVKWGADLISNFIKGMLSKADGLGGAAHTLMGVLSAFFPHSPAKVGPFSGAGAPEASGRALMRDFAKGALTVADQTTSSINSALSNVNFGTGAVIANFYGAQPTPAQAQTLGTAVANGIGDQLLARNARLAVRTM